MRRIALEKNWQQDCRINERANERLNYNVVSGRLNVVKSLKRTNRIVSLGRRRHIISL